jgi:hypothetical protein
LKLRIEAEAMKLSVDQQKKASQLIPGLIPSKKHYDEYVADTRHFKREFNDLNRFVPELNRQIQRIELLPSKVFGRKYLVGFHKKEYMTQIAPHCNAIASTSISFIDQASPPLVLIPGRTVPESRQFSFILEHEFVHVNQAILGRFPNLDLCELSEHDLLFRSRVTPTSSVGSFWNKASAMPIIPPQES